MIFNITPKPTPRPRVAKRGNKSIAYYPKEYQQYKDALKLLARSVCKNHYKGALKLEVTFFMQIPKSLSKKKQSEHIDQWHIKKPDNDNLIKGVKDALEGIAYDNDSQVCYEISKKIYSTEPRIEVLIEELSY